MTENGVYMKKYRKIIKIGNSLGVTFPRQEFTDLEKGDWVEITVKKVR